MLTSMPAAIISALPIGVGQSVGLVRMSPGGGDGGGGTIPGALGIYGTRQVVPGYTGPVVTLSDNAAATTDIGTYDGWLDGPSAQAAIDLGQTGISKFWDQNGTGNHLVQLDFDHMYTLNLDGTPSHRAVLTPNGKTCWMLSPDNSFENMWAGGGYMALGLRYRTGNTTKTFISSFSAIDAQFSFPISVGASAHMALEIFYNSDSPETNLATIKIDGAAVGLSAVQYGKGSKKLPGLPYCLGGAADGAGGYDPDDCDIWELHVYKDTP